MKIVLLTFTGRRTRGLREDEGWSDRVVPADPHQPIERERGARDRAIRVRTNDNVCVYPRDDVNTPHESTRLLGRGGRAAQFGCSRSSLVTRRNSAQVVLLCGECGTGASTYDLSLPLYLSLSLPHSLSMSALFVFSTLLPSFCSSLYAAVFTPFRSCPRFL